MFTESVWIDFDLLSCLGRSAKYPTSLISHCPSPDS